jgi:hypothetical protein
VTPITPRFRRRPIGASQRRRKGKRSERKPGGQPGHPGSGRGLLPIEQVDEVVEHLAEHCRAGGYSLAGRPPLYIVIRR